MKNIKIIFLFLFSFFLVATLHAKKISSDVYEGEEYLAFAEEMPQPVGGLQSIYKLIKYPKIAREAGLEGKVYVLAYINENGTVEDVKIIKGIGGGCDKAAVNAIKQCKFTPGKSKGKNVKVKLSLQIQFKIKK